jgi:hypothetical protein
MEKKVIPMVLFYLVLTLPNHLKAHVTPEFDMSEYVRNSGFIFKGRVAEIVYRNSEAVPVLDATGEPVYEEGQPVYVDGSNLPHTFVTYQIEEIYKGSVPRFTDYLTLRFEGGQSEVPDPCEVGPGGEPVYNDFLLVTDVPLFDFNDRDFLFVKGNEDTHCPLYNWARGRFRILDDPNDPVSTNMIYNEFGQQWRLLSESGGDPNGVILGEVQEIDAVLTHTMGQMELVDVYVDSGTEEEDPDIPLLPGEHATESAFAAYLTQVVQEECGTAVPPEDCGVEMINLDPNLPFHGMVFTPLEPNDVEEPESVFPRPWLDRLDPNALDVILEQERLESELFALSGGNPVLPETPCEFQMLFDGALIGDISGPEGIPDCYVNLFDVAALARVWLDCNNPEDQNCF